MILAESIDAAFGFLLWAGFAVVVLGLASFVPAARGHWAALPLAVPVACLGAVATGDTFIHSNPSMELPVFWFLSLAPLALGAASIVLWFVRRRSIGLTTRSSERLRRR